MKTYLRQYIPGSFTHDTHDSVVVNRTDKPELMPNAVAYIYYDRASVELNGEELLGPPKNYSPKYVIGTEMTAEQAIAENPNNAILKINLENNNIKRLIKTKDGQMLPLADTDVVIPVGGLNV